MRTAIRALVPRPALALLHGRRRRRKVARTVGVLFIDIQGCTRLREDLPPAEAEFLPPECPWRPLGARILKNVTDPVEVVEILPDGTPAARRWTDG